MSDDKVYKDGDIAWVKLGNNWWPGEVTAIHRQPEGLIKHLKRKPYCVVKFFQEDAYEYIKSAKQIFPFQCSKKDEFIKKGIALFNAKNKFMEKFPSDVEVAERLTRKAMATDTLIINDRPDSIVKAILGQSLTSRNNEYYDNDYPRNNSNTRRSGDSITKILNITPHRGNATTTMLSGTKSIYNASSNINKSSAATSKTSTPTSTSNNSFSGSSNTNLYRCNLCDFTSLRQNVMIFHRKTHSSGPTTVTIASAPKPAISKTFTVTTTTPLNAKLAKSNSSSLSKSPSTTIQLPYDTHAILTSRKATEQHVNASATSAVPIEVTCITPTSKRRLRKDESASFVSTPTTHTQSLPSASALTMVPTTDIVGTTLSVTTAETSLTTARLPKKKELALIMSKRTLRSSPHIVADISEITLPPMLITPTRIVPEETKAVTPEEEICDDSLVVATPALQTNAAKIETLKRNSEEIRQSLLADWSDEDREDEIENETQPLATDIESLPHPSTTTIKENIETNSDMDLLNSKVVVFDVIPSTTNTIAPTSNRIRNIPKKDHRRDIVLKEFNNEPASIILPYTTPTTPAIVNIIDSGSNSSDSVVVVDITPLNITTDTIDVDAISGEHITTDNIIETEMPPTPSSPTTKTVSSSEGTTTHDIEIPSIETTDIVAVPCHPMTSTLSCFDFQEDEDNDSDVLTSIANFKKKYLSPDKTQTFTVADNEVQKLDSLRESKDETSALVQKHSDDLEQKDQELASQIESLLEQTSITVVDMSVVSGIETSPTASGKEDVPVKGLPIKERGKRIFKSRNRSRVEEQPIFTVETNQDVSMVYCDPIQSEQESENGTCEVNQNNSVENIEITNEEITINELSPNKSTGKTVDVDLTSRPNQFNETSEVTSNHEKSLVDSCSETVIKFVDITFNKEQQSQVESTFSTDIEDSSLIASVSNGGINETKETVKELEPSTSLANLHMMESTKHEEPNLETDLETEKTTHIEKHAENELNVNKEDDETFKLNDSSVELCQRVSLEDEMNKEHEDVVLQHNAENEETPNNEERQSEVEQEPLDVEQEPLDVEQEQIDVSAEAENVIDSNAIIDDETIPVIKHSPVEIYRSESEEHIAGVDSANETGFLSTQPIAQEHTKSPPQNEDIPSVSNTLGADDSLGGIKDILEPLVNTSVTEQYSAELLNRFTSPTDENSSVGISETGAEFGSPTSMLDDERLPMLTDNSMTPTACLTDEIAPTIAAQEKVVDQTMESEKEIDGESLGNLSLTHLQTAENKDINKNTEDNLEIEPKPDVMESILSIDEKSPIPSSDLEAIAVFKYEEDEDEIESPQHEALSGTEQETEIEQQKTYKEKRSKHIVKRQSTRTSTPNPESDETYKLDSTDKARPRRSKPETQVDSIKSKSPSIIEEPTRKRVTRGSLNQNKTPVVEEMVESSQIAQKDTELLLQLPIKDGTLKTRKSNRKIKSPVLVEKEHISVDQTEIKSDQETSEELNSKSKQKKGIEFEMKLGDGLSEVSVSKSKQRKALEFDNKTNDEFKEKMVSKNKHKRNIEGEEIKEVSVAKNKPIKSMELNVKPNDDIVLKIKHMKDPQLEIVPDEGIKEATVSKNKQRKTRELEINPEVEPILTKNKHRKCSGLQTTPNVEETESSAQKSKQRECLELEEEITEGHVSKSNHRNRQQLQETPSKVVLYKERSDKLTQNEVDPLDTSTEMAAPNEKTTARKRRSHIKITPRRSPSDMMTTKEVPTKGDVVATVSQFESEPKLRKIETLVDCATKASELVKEERKKYKSLPVLKSSNVVSLESKSTTVQDNKELPIILTNKTETIIDKIKIDECYNIHSEATFENLTKDKASLSEFKQKEGDDTLINNTPPNIATIDILKDKSSEDVSSKDVSKEDKPSDLQISSDGIELGAIDSELNNVDVAVNSQSLELKDETLVTTAVVSEIRSFRPRRKTVSIESSLADDVNNITEDIVNITTETTDLGEKSKSLDEEVLSFAARSPSPSIEKVRINVDVANPLSSQIANILATSSSSSNNQPHGTISKKRTLTKSGVPTCLKRKKSIEDDIPSFIIERPTTQAVSAAEDIITENDAVSHVQNMCPQVKITRKEILIEPEPTQQQQLPTQKSPQHVPNEEATMFDISNMPILLTNDQLLPDNVHIVITPTSTFGDVASASSSPHAIVMSSSSNTMGDAPRILQQQILQIAHTPQQQQQQRQRKSSTISSKRSQSRQLQDTTETPSQTLTPHQKQLQEQQQMLQLQKQTMKKQIGIDSRGNKYVIIKTPPVDLVVQQAPLQQHAVAAVAPKAQTATYTIGSGVTVRPISEPKTSSNTVASPPQQQQQLQTSPSKPKSPAAAATGGRKQAGNTITLPSSGTVKHNQQKFNDDIAEAANVVQQKLPIASSKNQQRALAASNRRKAQQQQRKSTTSVPQTDSSAAAIAAANRRISFTAECLSTAPPAKLLKTSGSGSLSGEDVTMAQQQLMQLQQQQQHHKAEPPPPLHHLHNRKPRKQPQQHRGSSQKKNIVDVAATEMDVVQQQQQQQQQTSVDAAAVQQTQQIAQSQQAQSVHSTTFSEEQLMQAQTEDHLDGTSKILAVPTQPIPGYNETFLLCTLVNNNYKPIDNVPLYLDHDLNQLVPVPLEALDGQPNLIVNHPPPEETTAGQMQLPAQTQQHQQQQQQQQQVLTNNTLKTAAEADSSTQMICLQPVVDSGAILQQQLTAAGEAAAEAAAAAQMAAVYMPADGEVCAGSEIVADNAVILNVEGQQIILDAATFAHLLANPDANTQLITDDGTEFVLTREVLAALEAQQVAQNAEAAAVEQQLQLVAQQQLHTDTGPTDILAVALAGTGLYPSDVLEIETAQASLSQLMASEGSIVFQPPHLTPPITAHTSETNALLNQTPIMSTGLDKSSNMLGKRKQPELSPILAATSSLLATSVSSDLPPACRPNLEDSLAVIGVSTQSSTVPISLELPITVTNPAIATKVTMAAQPPHDHLVQFQPHRSVAAAIAAANETSSSRIYNDPGS